MMALWFLKGNYNQHACFDCLFQSMLQSIHHDGMLLKKITLDPSLVFQTAVQPQKALRSGTF